MADAANKSEGRKGGGNTTPLLIAGGVLIVVLVAALVVMAGKLQSSRANTAQEPERRNVVVNEQNVQEVIDDMLQEEYVEPGYYAASMSTIWHFANGNATSSDAYVANDASNTNDVYFDLVLADDEDTVILASPVIPLGGRLDNISLDTPLNAGTYSCIMIYHLVDENQETLSTLRVGVTIIVES